MRGARHPQLDGLRAIAAGLVVLTHLAFLSGIGEGDTLGGTFARLNVGVALFFLLSGFLLHRPWVAARRDGQPGPALPRYALRRVTRLLPAYWLALVVLAVVLPSQIDTPHWWVSGGLLQVYQQGWILSGIPPAWSLSTEVAFYVVLPLVAALGGAAWGTRAPRAQLRGELLALVVTAVAAMVVRQVALSADWMQTFPNTLIGKWPWFALGMALAVLSVAAERPGLLPAGVLRGLRAAPWLWWTGAAAVLVLAANVLPSSAYLLTDDELQLETVLFAGVAACLAVPVVFGDPARRGSPAALLASPVAVWLGTVSYGVFLWHYPIVGWTVDHRGGLPLGVAWVIAVAVTLGCAAASWYGLERPLLRRTASGRAPALRPDQDPVRVAPAVEPAP